MRIVKITFGDEIRRVKMPTTVILLEELKARLLCLFPALAALHCESDANDISIQLMFKEIAIVRDSQLQDIFSASPDRVSLCFMVSCIEDQKSEEKKQPAPPTFSQHRFRRHYDVIKIDGVDSGGRNVVDLNALPPVITTTRIADIGAQLVANVLPAYGAEDWIILEDGDDDEEEDGKTHHVYVPLPVAVHAAKSAKLLPSPLPALAPALRTRFISSFSFTLNGVVQVVDVTSLPRIDMNLDSYLRDELELTGTRIGCGEGGCGACTVLLTMPATPETPERNVSINSCLRPLLSLDGYSITTVEGLGSAATGYHAIQQRLAQGAGTQCGYCSSGMVMNMYGLLSNTAKPTEHDVENHLGGNICRCTGYRPILTAFKSFVPQAVNIPSSNVSSISSSTSIFSSTSTKKKPCTRPGCKNDCDTCPKKGKKDHDHDHAEHDHKHDDIEDLPFVLKSAGYTEWAPYDAPMKAAAARIPSSSTGLCHFSSDSTVAWFRPATLVDVYPLLLHYQSSGIAVRLTVGNTSTGVIKYLRYVLGDKPSVYIDVSRIAELNTITNNSAYVSVGAAVSLTSLANHLEALLVSQPEQSLFFGPIIRHILLIGNTQLRNMGSWAGNIMMAHQHPDFPSDVLIMLSALHGCSVVVSSPRGQLQLDVLSLMDYVFAQDEIVLSLVLPMAPVDAKNVYYNSYKIMPRHQNAHAIVNACFYLQTDASGLISDAMICFGGVINHTLACGNTMQLLVGKPLASNSTLTAALSVLKSECSPPPNTNGNQADPIYRQSLATALFYKFFLGCQAPTSLPPTLVSASIYYDRPISSGVQVFTPDATEAPVSEAIPKLSGILQTSGEAQYACDRPILPNTLFGVYVLSSVCATTIVSIDVSAALAMEGVAGFMSAKDIAALGGVNDCGAFPGDEEVFASVQVNYVGQPIGLIVADSDHLARAATKLVAVTYAPATTAPIVTIEQAIAANSYLLPNQYASFTPSISCGDVDTAYKNAPNKLTGELRVGGQSHFYMETQACVVEPDFSLADKPPGMLRVFLSTQGPADARNTVALAVNRPSNRIIVEAGRMGGAFGGKLTRCHPVAAALAVAAARLNRPVRMQLHRQEDMLFVGKRHPFLCSYQVGFGSDGTIQALHIKLWTNSGWNYDTTFGSMDMAQLWQDNCYYLANYKTEGFCCRTNLPPNTAMRSPGVLASIHFMETIIERVALTLNMSPNIVREKNFYQNGQLTPYQQPLKDLTISNVWQGCIQQTNYTARLSAVQAFNASNRWVKRGLSLTPVKYGFELAGNAHAVLINVNALDGTVNISHSGCELGQGLSTKVLQCVAYALAVPIDAIVCMATSTDKTPNMTMTGGSSTSEAVCQAALNGCVVLNSAMSPFRTTGQTWAQLVSVASGNGVNLSAVGWYAPSASAFPPYPFAYFVYAAACSEVRLDVLTGETQVLQTDIVYDAGQSLNPIVDIGQIEGGFVMAMGYWMTEECRYDATGRMINTGTWDYKPLASDIPLNFNVTLLAKTPNAAAGSIMRSKGSAEPPLCLASTVVFATKMAIQAARAEIGATPDFQLDQPASLPVIQRACLVEIEQMSMIK